MAFKDSDTKDTLLNGAYFKGTLLLVQQEILGPRSQTTSNLAKKD